MAGAANTHSTNAISQYAAALIRIGSSPDRCNLQVARKCGFQIRMRLSISRRALLLRTIGAVDFERLKND
jgi:hypothetical protein